MNWISSWEIRRLALRTLLDAALERGEIAADQEVWSGPDGSYVVVDSAADLDDTEYADFTDTGETVEEVISQ